MLQQSTMSMSPNLMGQSGMVFGMLWMAVWVVVSILLAVAFYRGMHALVQISKTLMRIEQHLTTHTSSPPSRDVGGI